MDKDERIVNNPFPGLRPFKEDEESLFFGREKAVADLMSQLRSSRFMAVIGASGSGKSSLIIAGLLPALYRGFMVRAGSNWRVALFRPGGNPIGNLAGVLLRTGIYNKSLVDTDNEGENNAFYRRIIETTLRRDDGGLLAAVEQARLPEKDNLLIVVDQFEELFRFSGLERGKGDGKEDSAAFVKLLLETRGQTRLPIYIILTMRSDFLGDCTSFMGLPEAINKGQYLVPRMTREEKRAAISGPAAVGGGEISVPMMSRLLNDVGDNPDQLPILQHALMRTWDYHAQHSRGGEPIDIHHYEAIGGMEQALSQHAEEAFAELKDDSSGLLCEKLFKLITDTGETGRGVRRPARVGEICRAAEAPKEKVIEVIDLFRRPGRTFLMPPHDVELNEDSVIDISHESFMRIWTRLTGWVKEEAQSAELYGRLATSAALYDEGKVGLWRDPELMLAMKWRAEENPNEVWARRYDPSFQRAVRFLEDSKKQHDLEIEEKEREQREKIRKKEEEKRQKEIAEKKKKYYRIIFSIVGFAVICLAILTIYAFQQKGAAVEQKAIAVEQRERAEAESLKNKAYELAARSVNLLDKDPTFSFGLAESAYRTEKANPAAYNALLDVFYYGEFYRTIFPHDDYVNSAGFSPDGKTIVTIDRDKTERVWDFNGKLLKSSKTGNERVRSAPSSPDGKRVEVSVDSNKTARVLAPDGTLIRVLKGHKAEITSTAFSPDGKYVITASKDRTARLWDLTPVENKIKIFSRHTSDRSDFFAAFSPDGNRIVTVSSEKAILWDLSGSRIKEAAPADRDLRLGKRAAFSPEGKYIIFLTDVDEKLGIWDLEGAGNEIASLQLTAGAYSVAVSPGKNRRLIAAASQDNTARLFDWQGKEVAIFKGHKQELNSAAFSPDGKYIVTASWDETARLWDLNGNEKEVFKGHDGSVNAAVFSPDGKHIVTAGSDGTARLWDLKGNQLQVFEGHGAALKSAVLSPNGRYMITGSEDNTARLWNLNGIKVYEFKGFKDIIHFASFSPNGKYVLIAPAKGPAQYRLIDPQEIIAAVKSKNVWQLDEAAKKKYNL